MHRSVILAALAALVLAPAAAAHVKTNEGRWLLSGSTYSGMDQDDEPPRQENRTDPVSVMWRGGNHDYTIGHVVNHTHQHWRDRRIPDRFPNGRFMEQRRDNPLCRDAQFIFMRQSGDANDGDFSPSQSYMSTNGACTNQYHIRLWNDDVHGGFFGSNHFGEFVVSPIHHETTTEGGHEIDLEFDHARRIYYLEMAPHCKKRRWAVHPESDGWRYSDGVPYTGIITKISMRHRSDTCNGAF